MNKPQKYEITPLNPLTGITLRPWGAEDPFLIQAVAEALANVEEEKQHPIVNIVRESSLDAVLGFYNRNPANQTNNFSRDENGAEGGPNNLIWELPAHGIPKATCGHFMRSKTYGCPEGHEIHAKKCKCYQMDCPVCYPEALRRGAKRIAMHLDVANQLNGGLFKLHHVIASPPQGWAEGMAVTKDGFKALRKAVHGALMDCGAVGGVVLFHPYRKNKGGNTWRIGPHFHALVFGRADSSKRPEGWVIKDKGAVPVERAGAVAYYVLSHVGLAEGVARIPSYFGNCSTAGKNSPCKVYENDLDVPKRCKVCDGSLFNFPKWLGSDPTLRGFIEPEKDRQKFRIWTARKDKDKAKQLLDGKQLDEALEIVELNPWMVWVRDATDSGEISPEEIDWAMRSDDAGHPSDSDYSTTSDSDYSTTSEDYRDTKKNPTDAVGGSEYFFGFFIKPWDVYPQRPKGAKRRRKRRVERGLNTVRIGLAGMDWAQIFKAKERPEDGPRAGVNPDGEPTPEDGERRPFLPRSGREPEAPGGLCSCFFLGESRAVSSEIRTGTRPVSTARVWVIPASGVRGRRPPPRPTNAVRTAEGNPSESRRRTPEEPRGKGCNRRCAA